MKKLMSFLITLTLLLSAIIVPVRAEGETQRIYARIWGFSAVREECPWNLADEDGYIYYAAIPNDSEIAIGTEAWFTYEKRKGESSDYLYVTSIEEIPETGEEVGFMYRGRAIYNDYEEAYRVYIYSSSENPYGYLDYTVYCNGIKMPDDKVVESLNGYVGAVSYKVRNNRIYSLSFIENPKQSITNQMYDAESHTFAGLKYPITESTNILFLCFDQSEEGYIKKQFTGFKPGYVYSFDVISYDKDKNARCIVVHSESEFGMGLCTYNSGDCCITKCENGRERIWNLGELDSSDEIKTNSMIEFFYHSEPFVSSITSFTPLEGKDYTGYTYNKENNTFGGYSLKDISILDVETDPESGDITKYAPLVPSDKLQYDGKIFTSSYGQSVLWVTGSKPADGNPVVEFWSNPSESELKVGAIYHKNGYTGDGTIYLAVYCNDTLRDVYTYDLAEKDSQYNDYYEEYDPVIFKRFVYDENTGKSDYSVKGFVWYNNLTPIYPAFSA